MNDKLKHYLLPGPGETSPAERRKALRRLAMDLATQFPDSPEIKAIGERLERLLEDV